MEGSKAERGEKKQPPTKHLVSHTNALTTAIYWLSREPACFKHSKGKPHGMVQESRLLSYLQAARAALTPFLPFLPCKAKLINYKS